MHLYKQNLLIWLYFYAHLYQNKSTQCCLRYHLFFEVHFCIIKFVIMMTMVDINFNISTSLFHWFKWFIKIKNENNSKFIEHDVINLLCDEHYLMHLQFLYFWINLFIFQKSPLCNFENMPYIRLFLEVNLSRRR